MASRLLNRRELRKQADQADISKAAVPEAEAPKAVKEKKAKSKAPASPKVRKPRAKKAPPRMRARWGVFDGSMKQLAIFDFNQKGAADAKLADFRANKKGVHFLQIVKDPMPESKQADTPSDS